MLNSIAPSSEVTVLIASTNYQTEVGMHNGSKCHYVVMRLDERSVAVDERSCADTLKNTQGVTFEAEGIL